MKNQRGSSQSMTVFIVALVTLVALAGVIIVFVTKELREREVNKKLAQEVAEYGMEMALMEIQKDPLWNQGFLNVKYRGGYYTVNMEKANDTTFSAIPIGYVNNMKRRIVCTYNLANENGVLKPKRVNWE